MRAHPFDGLTAEQAGLIVDMSQAMDRAASDYAEEHGLALAASSALQVRAGIFNLASNIAANRVADLHPSDPEEVIAWLQYALDHMLSATAAVGKRLN